MAIFLKAPSMAIFLKAPNFPHPVLDFWIVKQKFLNEKLFKSGFNSIIITRLNFKNF